MKVKFISNLGPILGNYLGVCNIKNKKYKNIEFVDDNSYTHIIVVGTINQKIYNFLNLCKESGIPKKNIFGFALEPVENIPFLKNKNIPEIWIGEYRVSKKLPHYKNNLKIGYSFLWTTTTKNITNKYIESKKISIILSNKKYLLGHNYRHLLVDKILKTNLDIHIYGNGSEEHGNDSRIKGKFSWEDHDKPYTDYMYHIVIENTPNTEFYVTEKFTNAIITNTIPIYYGADKINNIFGDNCCYKLCGDLNKDLELITNIYNNCEKYKLDLKKAQYEIFNGKAFLPKVVHEFFTS